MKIPTWDDAHLAVSKGTDTVLDRFVYRYSSSDVESAALFHKRLEEVAIYIFSAKYTDAMNDK